MASYIYKMHIADNYFVDFADADPRFSGDGFMVHRFGKAIKDETLAQFGLFLYSRNGRAYGEGFMKPRRLKNILTVKDLTASASQQTRDDVSRRPVKKWRAGRGLPPSFLCMASFSTPLI